MFNKLGFAAPPMAALTADDINATPMTTDSNDVAATSTVQFDAEPAVPVAMSPEATASSDATSPTKKSTDAPRRKRSRRRRKPKSRSKVEPLSQKEKLQQQQQQQQKQQHTKEQKQHKQKQQQNRQQTAASSKKQHDAPMTKRDLYFALKCEMVGIAPSNQDAESHSSAVGRVTVVNWENQVVLDTFVQVPVPVTDFRTSTSGIVPADVYSTQAMSFAQVRAAVEQIITGKILIGHSLEVDLIALGLRHPWCDVRDTASFTPFLAQFADPVTGQRVLRPRTLRDLAWTILKREMPEPSARTRPLQDCIACLDLYKAFRREWEQDLVQRAQQKESQQLQQQQQQQPHHQQQQQQHHQQQQQQQQQQQHQQQQQRQHHQQQQHHQQHQQLQQQQQQQHSNLYGQNVTTAPNDFQVFHPSHHHNTAQHQPQRPRIRSFEMLPPTMIQPPTYGLGHITPQQQVSQTLPQEMMSTAASPSQAESMQQHAMNQSSWFRRARKPRYAQPSVTQHHQHHQPVSSTALSAQAMEVLSSQDTPIVSSNSFDRHASSMSYDGSTLYEASTDYESSTLYEESVASESIASRQYQPEEVKKLSQLEEAVNGCGSSFVTHQHQQRPQQQPSSESSSWFRFGSKRSTRYPQQQSHQQQGQSQVSQSLTVLQELAEEQQQQQTPAEDLSPPAVENDSVANDVNRNDSDRDGTPQVVQQMESEATPYYEPPKYFTSLENTAAAPLKPAPSASTSSTWFGFRRSKSPKQHKESGEVSDSAGEENKDTEQQKTTLTSQTESGADNNEEAVEVWPAEQPLSSSLSQMNNQADDEITKEQSPESSFFSYNEQTAKLEEEEDPVQQREEEKRASSTGSSSWFSFRRSRSPSSKERRRSNWLGSSAAGHESVLGTLKTESTAGTEEDWLRELMHQPGNAIDDITEIHQKEPQDGADEINNEVIDDTTIADVVPNSKVDKSAETVVPQTLGEKDDDETTVTTATTTFDQHHQEVDHQEAGQRQSSSNWLNRFLRKASATRQVSRLEAAAGAPASPIPAVKVVDGITLNGHANLNERVDLVAGLESFASTQATITSSSDEDDILHTSMFEGNDQKQGEPKESNATDDGNEDWLEEVVAPNSCLSPAWFSFQEQSKSQLTTPSTEGSPSSSNGLGSAVTTVADGSVAGLEQLDYFLRSRLCTESTIPTVASEEEEEEEDYLQEFVQGMEKNFSFLNI